MRARLLHADRGLHDQFLVLDRVRPGHHRHQPAAELDAGALEDGAVVGAPLGDQRDLVLDVVLGQVLAGELVVDAHVAAGHSPRPRAASPLRKTYVLSRRRRGRKPMRAPAATGLPVRTAPAPRRCPRWRSRAPRRSEEHTSELQSLMRISYAVFCLKKKTNKQAQN